LIAVVNDYHPVDPHGGRKYELFHRSKYLCNKKWAVLGDLPETGWVIKEEAGAGQGIPGSKRWMPRICQR